MTERIVRRTPLKRTPFKRSKPRKTPVPKATREFVLRRDGGCVLRDSVYGECWGGNCLHHIKRQAQGGGHENHNLVTLCAFHHIHQVHGNPAWARDMGLLR